MAAHDSNTTRRTVLTGLAAVPAVSAPALATGDQISPKLLDLRRQLIATRAAAVASSKVHSELGEAWPRGDEVERKRALKAAEERWTADLTAEDELERQIMAEPTTTPEEFALKFEVAASGSLEEALTAELSSDYLDQAVAARLLIDAAKLLGVAVA
jgi:hypothetical protein